MRYEVIVEGSMTFQQPAGSTNEASIEAGDKAEFFGIQWLDIDVLEKGHGIYDVTFTGSMRYRVIGHDKEEAEINALASAKNDGMFVDRIKEVTQL